MRIRDIDPFNVVATIILITVFIVGVIVLANARIHETPCTLNQPTTFECRSYQVDQCLKSELYTREECIALVGGGGK